MTIEVSDFGTIFYAFFDPVGELGEAGTIDDSFIATASEMGGRMRLDDFGWDVTVVSQSATQYVTRFFTDWNEVTLSQRLVRSVQDGMSVGAALVQEFRITNVSEFSDSFDVVRYLDGDLLFDDSISDSRGQIAVGSNSVLFETEAGSVAGAETTFLGMTTAVAGVTGAVPQRNFQILPYPSLLFGVLSGADLDNSIFGDGDGDGFTDFGYDVTLAFQDFLTVEAGQTVVYTTTTLFGNAVPPAPGETETTALLPDSIGPEGGFVFEIAGDIFDEGETFWIDPIIAVGYTYTITGAEFASVTAPTLGLVPDPDGYVVTVGANSFALAAGATHIFDDGVIEFTITDIATSLALDPASPTAFATGVSLRDIVARTIVITQTPITLDVPDVAPVPLPAGGVLLGAGLLGLLVMRRRRV